MLKCAASNMMVYDIINTVVLPFIKYDIEAENRYQTK